MKGNDPTYSIDCSEKKLSVKVRTIIKFENRAKESGLKVATLMKDVLDEAVENDPWTIEDEDELHNRIKKNIKRNEKIKTRRANLK